MMMNFYFNAVSIDFIKLLMYFWRQLLKLNLMRLLILQGFILINSLLISGVSLSQSDSIGKSESHNDSILFVVPEIKNAELSMIVPPSGFEVSTAFNGYIHMGASSAIILTMIEGVNFIKIAEGMTDEYFTRNKLTRISESKIDTDSDLKGISYKLSFAIDKTDFIRYMVYIGDLNRTLWLNITYPVQVEELVEAEILKSIQSVNFNTTDDEK